MCGISAILGGDVEVDPEALKRSVAALHHRGPDGRGAWVHPQRRVALGHARLSIIDLDTGAQPIANEDETIHIVVNGEFYDFEQIRERLESRGHVFRTGSDSEIALHLYEDLGPQCLHELRGEFAFVIWDGRNDVLFAARDRFGVKPLFFAEHAGATYLASEVKGLFAAGVPARWDHQTVYTGDLMRATDRSLYDGVRAIPPGHYMLARGNGHRLMPYWDVRYPRDDEPQEQRSDQDWIDGFREVFEESVRTRLRADVPVGCYLSGGLDSCAVLGLAAIHHDGPVRAFTLTFEGTEYDEGPIAEEMSILAGADFNPIAVRQSDLAANFADAVVATETAMINGHGVAKYMLSRAVREAGYKVVLTGEGSDEILGGYPHFRRDMLLYHTVGQDPVEVQRLLEGLEQGNTVSKGLLLPSGDIDHATIAHELLGFAPSWVDTFSGTFGRMRKLFSDDFLHENEHLDGLSQLFSSVDVLRRLQGRNAVHAALYLWAKSALPGYILTVLGDRMEMAHSIEGRVPFLDHKVAEYLHRVPVALKIHGMTEKYILREATRDAITDSVYRRQKHPFLSPPATLHPEEDLHELLQDTLRGPIVEGMPFVDGEKLTDYLDEVAAMEDFGDQVMADQALTSMLSLAILHDRLGMESV